MCATAARSDCEGGAPTGSSHRTPQHAARGSAPFESDFVLGGHPGMPQCYSRAASVYILASIGTISCRDPINSFSTIWSSVESREIRKADLVRCPLDPRPLPRWPSGALLKHTRVVGEREQGRISPPRYRIKGSLLVPV